MNRLGLRLMSAANVAVYRWTGGQIGGRIGKAPVLLLTTRGRRTGKERTTPLLYHEDSERLIVVASKGGAPTHPAWFLNLQAEPRVTVELGRGRRELRAREADDAERERYWPRLVALYPGYARYQERTSRRIPLVVLEPV